MAHSINNQTTGCVIDPPITGSFGAGDPINIILVANVGQKFDVGDPPMLIFNDSWGGQGYKVFTISVDELTATLTTNVNDLADILPNSDLFLFGSTIAGPYVYETDTTYVIGCTATPPIPAGYLGTDPINVTLVANPDTVFDPNATPYIEYDDSFAGIRTVNFTLSGDNKTATINIPTVEDLPDINIEFTNIRFTASTIPDDNPTLNYGSINAYIVTDDNLSDFADLRFTIGGDVVDLGIYVNRINRVFVKLDEGTETEMLLGDFNTGITVHQILSDTVTLDFGSVEIPAKNGDATDNLSVIQIMLPFVGLVNIPTDYVGKEIQLVYEINVITGNGLAKILYDGVLIQSEALEASTDVIYRTYSPSNTTGGDNWTEVNMYGLEPYVYLKWYESLNPDEINNDNVRAKLDTFTGFIQATNVTDISTTNMYADEKDMIYSLLENGVFI